MTTPMPEGVKHLINGHGFGFDDLETGIPSEGTHSLTAGGLPPVPCGPAGGSPARRHAGRRFPRGGGSTGTDGTTAAAPLPRGARAGCPG